MLHQLVKHFIVLKFKKIIIIAIIIYQHFLSISTVRILPLGFIIYFASGALIMKYHYKATGSDIIPNKTFWIMLPGLIKVRPSLHVICLY